MLVSNVFKAWINFCLMIPDIVFYDYLSRFNKWMFDLSSRVFVRQPGHSPIIMHGRKSVVHRSHHAVCASKSRN